MTVQESNSITFSTVSCKVAVCLMLGAAVILLVWEVLVDTGQFALIAVGLLSFVAITLPLLIKPRFQLFEPIVLFVFSVFIGCTLRAIMLAFSGTENYKVIFLTDGMPLADIATNAVWVPLSLAILSMGYISASSKRFAIERFFVVRNTHWNRFRLFLSMIVLALISFVAILQISQATGVDFSDIARLSVKRAVQVDAAEGAGYARLGYLRWAADLAKLALFLVFADRLSRNRNKAGILPLSKILYGTLVLVLLLLSIAWPILSSSRTGILEVIFGLVVLFTYLGFRGGVKAQKRKFTNLAMITTIFALLVLIGVGLWRQHSQRGEVLDESLGMAILNNTVGTGNFLPLARTALIIDRMSQRDDWYRGQSYLKILFAPVPRSIWHDKPEMGLGLFVKRDLYNRFTDTNGYPPGLLGEAFINFGVFGLGIVPFLAGSFLKIFFNSFRPLLTAKNKNAAVLYALVLWPLGFQLADLDFTLMMMNMLTALIPGILFLSFVSCWRRI